MIIDKKINGETLMNINNRSKYIETNTVADAYMVRNDGSAENHESDIVREHNLNIFINDELVMRLVCTPNDLTELVIGRLISGGYIESTDEIDMISICEYGKDARVFLKKSECLIDVGAAEEPTCCTDNRVIMTKRPDGNDVRPLKKADFKSEWVFALAAAFKDDSKIHRRTSGTHSCYLAIKGDVVYTAEDIGRHNALDKAVGAALLKGYDLHDCMLFTTGRVPADMARKAITAGIPVLVSKSVPTDAAIELASEYNLTLICKAWPDSFEIFNYAV
jgi:FdhD protein